MMRFGSFASIVPVLYVLMAACGPDRQAQPQVEDCGKLGVWVHGRDLLLPPNKPEEWEGELDRSMTRAATNLLSLSVEAFSASHGRYPVSFQEVREMDLPEHIGQQCRLTATEAEDAWGQEFSYHLTNDGQPVITSPGPDGTLGTEDDISAPHPTAQGARPIALESDCSVLPSDT